MAEPITENHIKMLMEKAREAGFTETSLSQLLVMLNLNLHALTVEELRSLWPYVNKLNAEKFGG